jgi:hypothetical protein
MATTSQSSLNGATSDFASQHDDTGGNGWGPFSGRVLGATPGDWSAHTEYSLQKKDQDLANGGLGSDVLNDLAAFAKTYTQANGCYYDCTNDDDSGSDCGWQASGPLSYNQVRLSNKTFGTDMSPRLCYVEFPFNYTGLTDPANGSPMVGPGEPDANSSVVLRGNTTGAGVLVVKGELNVAKLVASDTFSYKGLIIVVGPAGTVRMMGNADVDINGGILLGTSERHCTATPCSGGNIRHDATEAHFVGTGLIQYDSQAVAEALNVLSDAGWTMPNQGGGGSGGGTPTVTIQTWR